MYKLILIFLCSTFLMNAFAQPTNALHFNNSYVDINNISQKLSPLNAFTIEFWVKYKGADNTDYNTFYGVNPSDFTNRMVIRTSGPFDGVQGTAVVLLQSTTPIYLVGSTIIDDFECHHIAFTYDNQVCKLFVDGNLDATLNYSFNFLSDDLHSLGQEYDNNPTVLSAFYNGMMDDFRIWNYARSQAEIVANKATELVGNETGLIVNYDFNQGVPNGNNTSINSLFNKADPTQNGTLMNFILTGSSSNFIDGPCVVCDLNIDNIQIIDPTCSDTDGTINITASGGNGTLTYSINNGLNFQNGNIFSNVPAGTYTVIVKDASGCEASQTIQVTAFNGPTINATISSTPIPCGSTNNGTATVVVSGGTAPYTFNWSPTGGNAATASNLVAGTYTVVITDDVGCSKTLTTVVSNSPGITISTTTTPVDCGTKNGTATATVSNGTGTITYTWNPGNLTGQTINNLSVGTYTVTATDGSGCTETSTVNVGQNGSLNLQANPYSAVVQQDSSINLNASFSPYISGTIYNWTPPNGLSCTDCPNPIASPTETTTYNVQITTPDGCIADTNITLIFKIKCGEYFVPTIFSPNGDGNNDEFKVYGKCITSINMKVYDRWGELVFESDDPSYGWDGTYKGQIMNTTSFVYVIDVTFLDDRIEHVKGNVSLVR